MRPQRLHEFVDYADREIVPAIADIKTLKSTSRIHIQRLIYTNLVDRFDAAIDRALLDNCREEALVAEASRQLTQPILEADLLRLLLKASDIQSALDERLETALRETTLRQRHSKKVAKLFEVMAPAEKCWNVPRVRITVGAIHEKLVPQRKTVPHSICGYADWLYSRRNTIVHGAGAQTLLKNDVEQIKKLFKCAVAPKIIIRHSSATIAVVFYKAVIEMLVRGAESDN